MEKEDRKKDKKLNRKDNQVIQESFQRIDEEELAGVQNFQKYSNFASKNFTVLQAQVGAATRAGDTKGILNGMVPAQTPRKKEMDSETDKIVEASKERLLGDKAKIRVANTLNSAAGPKATAAAPLATGSAFNNRGGSKVNSTPTSTLPGASPIPQGASLFNTRGGGTASKPLSQQPAPMGGGMFGAAPAPQPLAPAPQGLGSSSIFGGAAPAPAPAPAPQGLGTSSIFGGSPTPAPKPAGPAPQGLGTSSIFGGAAPAPQPAPRPATPAPQGLGTSSIFGGAAPAPQPAPRPAGPAPQGIGTSSIFGGAAPAPQPMAQPMQPAPQGLGTSSIFGGAAPAPQPAPKPMGAVPQGIGTSSIFGGAAPAPQPMTPVPQGLGTSSIFGGAAPAPQPMSAVPQGLGTSSIFGGAAPAPQPMQQQYSPPPAQYQQQQQVIQVANPELGHHEMVAIVRHESIVPKISTKDLTINSREYLFTKYSSGAKNYLNNILEIKEDVAQLIRGQKPLMNALIEIYDFCNTEMRKAEETNDGVMYAALEGFINIVEVAMLNNNYFLYIPEGDFDARTMSANDVVITHNESLNMKIFAVDKSGIIYMKAGQKVVIRVPNVRVYRYQANPDKK